MKNKILSLLIFPLMSFASSDNLSAISDALCIIGKISTIGYDQDNDLEVTVVALANPHSQRTLYTNRTASFPLIFSAFVNQITVAVHTNSCYNGGGFAEIKFLQS